MKKLSMFGIVLVTLLALPGIGSAQKWQSMKHPPAFQTDTSMQLTDGTVMVHEYLTPNWWRAHPRQYRQLSEWDMVEAGRNAIELWAAIFRFRSAGGRPGNRRGR